MCVTVFNIFFCLKKSVLMYEDIVLSILCCKLDTKFYYTGMYNNSLPPWSKTLLERSIVIFIVRKFCAVYVTQRFIAVFKRACHLSIST